MLASRVVYTCLFGYSEAFNDYAYEADGIDFICFTDNPHLTSESWQIRCTPRGLLDAPRASKGIKHLPHRYLQSYRESLYIDNTMHLKTAPRELFDDLLPAAGSPWTVFRHPWRQCIYDEATEVIRIDYDCGRRRLVSTNFTILTAGSDLIQRRCMASPIRVWLSRSAIFEQQVCGTTRPFWTSGPERLQRRIVYRAESRRDRYRPSSALFDVRYW
jgi:hypothetical protein